MSAAAAGGGVDPMALVRGYTDDELAVAAEFLATWFPFLSAGLCPSCVTSLRARVDSLLPPAEEASPTPTPTPPPPPPLRIGQIELSGWDTDPAAAPRHLPFEPSGWDSDPPPAPPAEKPKMSWADMAQEDELTAVAAAEEEEDATADDDGGDAGEVARQRVQLSRDQREQKRYQNVVRKKDFRCMERVRGRLVNVLDGLELHTGVFSLAEQKRIVECVYDLQERGKRGELGDRTYSEPQKWMRGKGRVTIQFGCCYNYATDKNGNPPGIMRTVVSDPLPELLKTMVKRLIRWNVVPTTCIPDSCIVNIYEPGDCIPPHIDSHDFVRPFCTVSFLSECNILFGSSLKVAGPGEFIGSFAIPLPVGSVLVINGNGADVAKHCVPAVPTKRISITFRRMDPAKRPFSFKDDPELLKIAPIDTVVQDADSSSDEGSTKTPDALIRNLGKISRGKRYNGRTSAVKADRGILGDQPAVDVLPQQNLHGRYNVSPASDDGEMNSAVRSRESRYRSDGPGMPSQVDDFREWPSLSAQVRRHGNSMRSSEDGAESGDKRTRMEHRQISIINRTIKDDVESLSVSSRELADRSRPMVRTIYNKPRRTRVMLDD